MGKGKTITLEGNLKETEKLKKLALMIFLFLISYNLKIVQKQKIGWAYFCRIPNRRMIAHTVVCAGMLACVYWLSGIHTLHCIGW